MHKSYYILKNKKPVPTNDVRKWGRMLDDIDNRRVGLTDISDTVTISTVFLGMTMSDGCMFETMIFTDGEGEVYLRTETWSGAELAHTAAINEALETMENANAIPKRTER